MGKYPYINIRGKYYCREYSFRKLAGLYFFDRKACRNFVDWRVLLRLFLDRTKLRTCQAKIELPACGAWCIRVRCGFKIFDPFTKTATKVFDEHIAQDLVREEIEQHRNIGASRFAPAIEDWNEQERWYREEYLSGLSSYYFSPESTGEFMRIYYQDVAPCLLDLITFKEPKTITVKERMGNMHADIRKQLDAIKETNPEIEQSIAEFYEYVCAQLDGHGDEKLYLVFAHGDFHLFNLFKTASGMKLIDWEGIGEQSLMYDFFNYFFSHLWVGRSRDKLAKQVLQAIEDMAQRLQDSSSGLARSLREKSKLYLMMYYFERIHANSTVFRSSPQAFLVWVNVYREFEKDRQRLMLGNSD